jgi:hypothetical protein
VRMASISRVSAARIAVSTRLMVVSVARRVNQERHERCSSLIDENRREGPDTTDQANLEEGRQRLAHVQSRSQVPRPWAMPDLLAQSRRARSKVASHDAVRSRRRVPRGGQIATRRDRSYVDLGPPSRQTGTGAFVPSRHALARLEHPKLRGKERWTRLT